MKILKTFAEQSRDEFVNTKQINGLYINSTFALKLMSLYSMRVVYILFEVYIQKRVTIKQLMETFDLSFDSISQACYNCPELFKYENGYWSCNINDLMKTYTAINDRG